MYMTELNTINIIRNPKQVNYYDGHNSLICSKIRLPGVNKSSYIVQAISLDYF